jgi:hypothetical protein
VVVNGVGMMHLARSPRLLARLNPAIALTSMLALLTSGLVACDAEPVSDLDDELAEAGDDSDEFRSLEQVAAAISVDPLFRQMINRSLELTSQRVAAQRLMSDEDLDAFARTISDPNYPEEIDLEEFAEATGVDKALVDQQMALAQQLISKYQLGGYTSEQVETVFSMAAGSEANQTYIKGLIEYEIEQLDEPAEPKDPQIEACEDLCRIQYAASIAIALQAYLAALAAATLAGPVGPILAGAATVTYFYSLAQAQGQLDECMAICNGEIISDDECLGDADCDPNDYCWTGVLGWGTNECRPEKVQGQTCSRHGQCLSGCCKLHFWTNPFSKTCRPADACN